MRILIIFVALLSLNICAGVALGQNGPPVLQSPSATNQKPTGPPVLKGARTQSSETQTATKPAAQSEDQDVDPDSVVRVSTNLISVPAVVMDRNGRYIPSLRREDFKIYEDGVEQQLAYFASVEKPFTVALMLDVSGSTQFQMAQICASANTFITRLRPNDQLMALTFDGQVHVLIEPTDVATVKRSKFHMPKQTDGTVLYDAFDLTLHRLSQIPGRKAIILFTDGVDQNSRTTLRANLKDAEEQDIMVYTVRYNTLPQLPQRLSVIQNPKARRKVQERMLKKYAVSESYLRALSDKTGGRFYNADTLADVAPAFAAITAELGVQYALGYYPKANSSSASQRNIKVRVRYPGMVVRARESYSTGTTTARDYGRD